MWNITRSSRPLGVAVCLGVLLGAALAVLAACNRDLPTAPRPAPVVAVMRFVFHLSDYEPDPQEINLYFDGTRVFSGKPFTYYGDVFDVWGAVSNVPSGQHAFALEVARPWEVRDARIDGSVEITLWRDSQVVEIQGASWDETAVIGQGKMWVGTFVIEEWPL